LVNRGLTWVNNFCEVVLGVSYNFAIGTHVKSTGEVGYVTLKRVRPSAGIERIEIRLEDA
jgi:Ser-tRNA(Ala) deacylase AlaX